MICERRKPAGSVASTVDRQFYTPPGEVSPKARAQVGDAHCSDAGHGLVCEVKPIGRRAAGSFTLIELLVTIAIVAVLAAMLLPALDRARDNARMVHCLSQQRQIYQASMLYASDHNLRLPDRAAYSAFPRRLRSGQNPDDPTYPMGRGSSMYDNFTGAIGHFIEYYLDSPIDKTYYADGRPHNLWLRNPRQSLLRCPAIKGLSTFIESHRQDTDYAMPGFGAHMGNYNYETNIYHFFDSYPDEYRWFRFPVDFPRVSRQGAVGGVPQIFLIDMTNHPRGGNFIRHDGSGARFRRGGDVYRVYAQQFPLVGFIEVPRGHVFLRWGDREDHIWPNPVRRLRYYNGLGEDLTTTDPHTISEFGY